MGLTRNGRREIRGGLDGFEDRVQNVHEMRVISKRRLREFWEKHPDARGPLEAWFKVAEKADWEDELFRE
jgi:hypothetical protein